MADDESEEPEWVSLNSSHLDAAKFDDKTGTLYIRYTNGAVYSWFGVTEDIFGDLLNAESPGRYAHTFIEGRYGKGQKFG